MLFSFCRVEGSENIRETTQSTGDKVTLLIPKLIHLESGDKNSVN